VGWEWGWGTAGQGWGRQQKGQALKATHLPICHLSIAHHIRIQSTYYIYYFLIWLTFGSSLVGIYKEGRQDFSGCVPQHRDQFGTQMLNGYL
jgi:hypothetical protein